MPADREPLDFASAAQWRRWLERNHARSDGEWVYMYKKGAAKKGLRYPDALDEALCWGWIDGQVRAVDADRFRQRWTPRRKSSTWSDTNKAKVKRLIAEGRMAAPGLAAVRAAKRDGRWQAGSGAPLSNKVPPELQQALAADPLAGRSFAALAPSYRRLYCGWVADAKTEATRTRRISAVVRRCRENRKPGINLYD
ncbi:MAG: YdeI/OmpD-associated family protein [bacterium]